MGTTDLTLWCPYFFVIRTCLMEIQVCKKCIVKMVCKEPCRRLKRKYQFYNKIYATLEIIFILVSSYVLSDLIWETKTLDVTLPLVIFIYISGMLINIYCFIQRSEMYNKFYPLIFKEDEVLPKRPNRPPPPPPPPPRKNKIKN